MFSKKDALQTWSKRTGEQPYRSTIPTRLLLSFIEITSSHGCAPENMLNTRRTPLFQDNVSWGLTLYVKRVLKDLNLQLTK